MCVYVCVWVIVCVMSVYCVCVTGEAQLVFVILIEAPHLSMDSLCCTQVNRLDLNPIGPTLYLIKTIPHIKKIKGNYELPNSPLKH